MDATNYDGRTALQVAAAEGHDEIIYYLLHECRVLPDNQDRYSSELFFVSFFKLRFQMETNGFRRRKIVWS